MVRNLLILMLFIGFGLGAGVAQSDIFVRQTHDNNNQEETGVSQNKSIFLRPFKSKEIEGRSKLYRSRRNTAGIQRQIEKELQTLEYWQKRKVGPRDDLEHKSYAFAMRASTRASMLKDRAVAKARMDAAREQRRLKAQQYIEATSADLEAVRRADALIEDGQGKRSGVAGVRTNYGARNSSTTKLRRVYRKPSTDLEKPHRVFRNYR